MRKIIVAAIAALFLLTTTVTGIAPTKPREVTNFGPVIVSPSPTRNSPSNVVDTVGLIPPTELVHRPRFWKKPDVIIKKLTPPPPVVHNGERINGVASWYCLSGVSRCTYTHGGGNYAAIRRDLLFLRGKYINVCANSHNCVRVQVIDCNCGPNANLIDLYSDAFRQLAPLSQGVIKVYIEY